MPKGKERENKIGGGTGITLGILGWSERDESDGAMVTGVEEEERRQRGGTVTKKRWEVRGSKEDVEHTMMHSGR